MTANDISGTPPSRTRGSIGPSAWPNAITPQGKPPNGTVHFNHSAPTHNAANQSGQPGSRRTMTAAKPKNPGNTACSADSASHGTAPTSSPVHGSRGM